MSDSLWWYEPGSPEWEREVAARTDDTDWDALEASVRARGGLWHVVVIYSDGRRDILGPHEVNVAFSLALEVRDNERFGLLYGLREGDRLAVDLEPLS